NPLSNKVVHADIRIQSIDDEPEHGASCSQNTEAAVQSQLSPEDVADQERAVQMQEWWEKASPKSWNLWDEYFKVSVLLIKWADDLDELKTGKETYELEALFRDRFHYHTKTIELNIDKKPQHQLNSHVSDFIRDYDGRRNLLVLYYTGHGIYHDDKKVLELTASRNPSSVDGNQIARCNWNKVEEKLKDEEVEGDVLTILDTCYSSNLVKSGKAETKKFELLSACSIDQTTASPGEYSYTRALIDALGALLQEYGDRPFSTDSLNQRILIDKRRSDTPSHVWSRVQSTQSTESHIFLAPLKSETEKKEALRQSAYKLSPNGYLTLRFGLRDTVLGKEQIEFMIRTLAKAFQNKPLVGLRKIDWLGIKPAPPRPHFEHVALAMIVIRQWRNVIKKRKENLQRKGDVSSSEAMEIDSANSPQKRTFEGDEFIPDAKRRNLKPSQPLSPPVSDSSRFEYD
ncbi:hypothetical protein BKA66DRAFT_386649, partial [Pyrenochaeta sp. MPI-SDFR-AT-0127]